MPRQPNLEFSGPHLQHRGESVCEESAGKIEYDPVVCAVVRDVPLISIACRHGAEQYGRCTGREYELTFDADTVTFLPHKDPTAPPGTKFTPGSLHYLARRVRTDLYLVHWLVRSPTMGNIHVALLVDLKEKHVHVSALMPKGVEFFDIADIQTMEWMKGKPRS
jgi:hypothetical protein